MILFCRNCGRMNNENFKSIEKAKCSNCGKRPILHNNRVIVECPSCHIGQPKDIWNYDPKCNSCGAETHNPLHAKCWGRTVNKGHSFKKFSLNLKEDELQWLKETSKKEGVQVGQILRLLVRKEGGLICSQKKKEPVESAE